MINDKEYELEAQKREAEFDSISNYIEKNKRIEKEVSRLNRLFTKIDGNKKKLVLATIKDVAFMTVTMQDLRDRIIRKGTTVEYKNGENQYGTKQSPDAQLYLQMSQKQTQAMKILVDCLPKTEKPAPQDDGFEDFVRGRDG
ncbi:hypothetical protein [Cuneatibacter caecimuris]|uniref:Phage terminase small subunit n=1 Tax=Cuneatibacter caecimuris TaxID=1796618 RepID=A0A4Q7PM00_9FIRM|nr:hypothetical protein [Cuneatibacter caecimuris]RZT00910.1 hypothetical protein EV209_1346 [Cuneatibacter caecimuris]